MLMKCSQLILLAPNFEIDTVNCENGRGSVIIIVIKNINIINATIIVHNISKSTCLISGWSLCEQKTKIP